LRCGLAFVLAVLLALESVSGQQAPVDRGEPRLDASITAAQARLRIPGISVAVYLDGAVRYAKAFGFADLEHRVAATPTTRFRTASVAKPLTATGVMLLAERGRLDLDAPIHTYCASFPQKPWAVSARQLLGHVAGVRHYSKTGESTGTEHFFTIAESLRLFSHDPLLFEPGTKYAYSTYGYSVLGCAIEGISRMPYADFMQQNVLAPSGMSHTALDEHYLVVPERARGYQLLTEEAYRSLPAAAQRIARPNEVYNAVLHDTSMKIPGGGWLSTSVDLVTFAAAMMDGRIVKPETRDEMWTSLKTADGKDTGYGLGFGVRVADGRLLISHSGNQAGASSYLVISPARKGAIAIMSNLEDAPLAELARELIGILHASETGRQ
jgi:CubicO group peptidase (beta-lactamase class C family)